MQQFESAASSRDDEKRLLENPDAIKNMIPLQNNYFLEYFIRDNPVSNPPFQIIKQGKEAVTNYFLQLKLERGKTEYLFESKLLVIGEGGTGKTTFIRKMKNSDSEMPKDEDTTLGIDVQKWSYLINFNETFQGEDIRFHVNLWDFGGQKIYQGTHQIFFSEKSFYVLIGDTREQKTDFTYWINTVQQLGGDSSSLVIILNKKFGHDQKFDESGYRSHFGTLIKEVIQLDLKNDTSKINALRDKIKFHLTQLPGIGDALPSSWVEIRDELSNEGFNFISFDRFREICATFKITDVTMVHTLSGYFNRIGVFTHYIDDSLLQERIYLNSNWLVKTVYQILDNQIVKSKKGRVTEYEIKKIWEKNDLNYEINKLTQLMHKFGLMYNIIGTKNYVVPAHLPSETPYEVWPYSSSSEVLHFIYEFDKYMPQGLMSRLIVSLNQHIANHELVWQRGLNIELNNSRAEIIESYGGTNRFEIRIVGNARTELLAIIREHFSTVLKPFLNLNYKQLVPCICEECTLANNPAFHSYDLLLKFREKGKPSQCSRTGELMSAEKLLKITESQPNNENIERKKGNKIIKIFLASSSELDQDRKGFREFISLENDRLSVNDIYLKIEQWEYFIDALSKNGLQAEYNKVIESCDIFVSLFCTKVGKYTSEEFETAFGRFKELGKPLIYTYFKNAEINLNDIIEEDILAKFAFEKKLLSLGHFKTVYTNIDDLASQFKRQLEFLLAKM